MFEVHVLTDPSQEDLLNNKIDEIRLQFPLLFSCKDMATLTSTGVSKRQPMVSGFMSTDDKQVAINMANSVASYLSKIMIAVTRIKVEQLITLDATATQCATATGEQYYEAHIKIGQIIPDSITYESLAMICLKYGVQLLFNPYSHKLAPVTTMRMYDTDLFSFKEKHTAFMEELREADFVLLKQHLEYGVYDSNVYTDSGWLFLGKDYKTPITSVDCDARLRIPKLLNVTHELEVEAEAL